MNTEFNDQQLVEQLRTGFAGATYDRAMPSLSPRLRLPQFSLMAVGAAAAVTGLLLATTGGSSPVLAWSPTPVSVTAADEAAARVACTVDPVAGSEGREAAIVGAPPVELPPLVAFDLRGTGGLATFADDQWTATCLVVRSGDGFERGPVVLEPTDPSAVSGPLAVSWASSSEWKDALWTMISGVAPAAAVTVEVSLPGQPVALANVVNGRFNMWWIGSPLSEGTGVIRALDAAGNELATAAPLVSQR